MSLSGPYGCFVSGCALCAFLWNGFTAYFINYTEYGPKTVTGRARLHTEAAADLHLVISQTCWLQRALILRSGRLRQAISAISKSLTFSFPNRNDSQSHKSSIKITVVLLNCLFVFLIPLKLELLPQSQALKAEKKYY